jgi:hypothetical protein
MAFRPSSCFYMQLSLISFFFIHNWSVFKKEAFLLRPFEPKRSLKKETLFLRPLEPKRTLNKVTS